MTSTNLKFDNYDLAELFSTSSGNTTYTGYYPNLNVIDNYSGTENTLKGTADVGYSINGSDIVAMFHPVSYDKDENSAAATTINVPAWCTKIGFVLQASGGSGGGAFSNYWQKITIPQQTFVSHNYSQTSTTTQTQWSDTNYAYNSRFWQGKCWWTRYTAAAFSITYGSVVSGSNYTTTYYNGPVNSSSYYGSGGGGGGCCAGVYTIDNNARITQIVLSKQSTYDSLYFDQDTVATSYTGGNSSTANWSASSSSSPIRYTNSDNVNTSTDAAGQGGSYTITNTKNRLTTLYGVNGATGTTTTGASTINNGGSSAYNLSPVIKSHFMPNFSTAKGVGANGSTTASPATVNNGYLRYWFVR
jgi:hypothetical protein